MKILHIFKTAYPDTIGGIEQVIHQLAKGACDQGHEVSVLTLSSEALPGQMDIHGYKIYRAKTHMEIASTPFSFTAIPLFKKLVQEADVINYHYPFPFGDMLHLVARVKKPAVVTYHSDILKQKNLFRLYKPINKKFLNDVNAIVATSPAYANSSDILQRYKHKLKIIPLGLDESTYAVPTEERQNYWQKKFGPKFFLFIGMFRYYKGLDDLLEASKKISVPIVLAGKGKRLRHYQNKIKKEKLTNVHTIGYVDRDDKVALLSICQALVLPSKLRTEAFGVSLLEGALHQKPLISCDIGTGTSFVNIDGETGFVVPPRSPQDLGAAMSKLLDDNLAQKMGKAARMRFEERFTGEAMVSSYLRLYEGLIS